MEKYIAIGIFAVCVAGICALLVYKKKKNNENFSFEDFLNTYTNQLLGALKDTVELLMINLDQFENKEEYEESIIYLTLEKLENNCSAFGIDTSLFKLVDRKQLAQALYNIFYAHEFDLFSHLTEKEIEAAPQLFDQELVSYLTLDNDKETVDPITKDDFTEAEKDYLLGDDSDIEDFVEETHNDITEDDFMAEEDYLLIDNSDVEDFVEETHSDITEADFTAEEDYLQLNDTVEKVSDNELDTEHGIISEE